MKRLFYKKLSYICAAAFFCMVSASAETIQKKIAAERDRFIQFLLEKGWDVIPSRTNFVFARNRKMSGEAVYQRIKQNGILVRHFDTRGIEEYVRISIGTQAQMDELKGIISGL